VEWSSCPTGIKDQPIKRVLLSCDAEATKRLIGSLKAVIAANPDPRGDLGQEYLGTLRVAGGGEIEVRARRGGDEIMEGFIAEISILAHFHMAVALRQGALFDAYGESDQHERVGGALEAMEDAVYRWLPEEGTRRRGPEFIDHFNSRLREYLNRGALACLQERLPEAFMVEIKRTGDEINVEFECPSDSAVLLPKCRERGSGSIEVRRSGVPAKGWIEYEVKDSHRIHVTSEGGVVVDMIRRADDAGRRSLVRVFVPCSRQEAQRLIRNAAAIIGATAEAEENDDRGIAYVVRVASNCGSGEVRVKDGNGLAPYADRVSEGVVREIHAVGNFRLAEALADRAYAAQDSGDDADEEAFTKAMDIANNVLRWTHERESRLSSDACVYGRDHIRNIRTERALMRLADIQRDGASVESNFFDTRLGANIDITRNEIVVNAIRPSPRQRRLYLDSEMLTHLRSVQRMKMPRADTEAQDQGPADRESK
jgi:hypothetical protein